MNNENPSTWEEQEEEPSAEVLGSFWEELIKPIIIFVVVIFAIILLISPFISDETSYIPTYGPPEYEIIDYDDLHYEWLEQNQFQWEP